MPSKGHKIAIRQANLRTKKRRGAVKPQPLDETSGPVNPIIEKTDEMAVAVADTVIPAKPTIEPRPASEVKPAPVKKSSHKVREVLSSETKLTYPYLGMEFKQLAYVLVLIAVILVTLYFVL